MQNPISRWNCRDIETRSTLIRNFNRRSGSVLYLRQRRRRQDPEGLAFITPIGESLPMRNGNFLLVGEDCFLVRQNCFLIGENFIQRALVLQDRCLILEKSLL